METNPKGNEMTRIILAAIAALCLYSAADAGERRCQLIERRVGTEYRFADGSVTRVMGPPTYSWRCTPSRLTEPHNRILPQPREVPQRLFEPHNHILCR